MISSACLCPFQLNLLTSALVSFFCIFQLFFRVYFSAFKIQRTLTISLWNRFSWFQLLQLKSFSTCTFTGNDNPLVRALRELLPPAGLCSLTQQPKSKGDWTACFRESSRAEGDTYLVNKTNVWCFQMCWNDDLREVMLFSFSRKSADSQRLRRWCCTNLWTAGWGSAS